MADIEQPDVAALTVQLLSAYLANNTVAHTDIADLVRTTKAALIEEKAPAPIAAEAPVHTPAVTVRKSLASPDHILSLIDGKPYKTLKRHLTSHGLTPASYRERYGLPTSYPMVAPGFAAQRRAIAEKIGLGRRPAVAQAASATEPSAPAVDAAPAPEPVKPVRVKKPVAKAETAPSPKAPAKKIAAKAPKAKPASAQPAVASEAPLRAIAEEQAKPTKGRTTLNLFKSADGAAKPEKSTPAVKAAANSAPKKSVRAKARSTSPLRAVDDAGSGKPDA
ncbi:MAG: MucR family transcriptional regulator [Sphingobium sp.]